MGGASRDRAGLDQGNGAMKYRTRIRLQGFKGPLPEGRFYARFHPSDNVEMLKLTQEYDLQDWYDYWRFHGLIVDRRHAVRIVQQYERMWYEHV
jgi:hypothetical protein